MARAHALRYAALAITDECSLSGVVRAHVEAQRLRLPLIVGAQMWLQRPAAAPSVKGAARAEAAAAAASASRGASAVKSTKIASAASTANATNATNATSADAGSRAGAPGPHLVLLAMSRRGYGNLAQWITVARRRSPKGQYLALMSDVEGRVPAAPTLAGLPDCLALLVASAALAADPPFETLFAHALWLKTWFGDRAAIALALHHHAHDALLVDITQRVSQLTGVPIAAVGDVRMHLRSRKALLDVLGATRGRATVASSGLALEPNAEAHLRSRARLAALYRPEWLAQTLVLAGRCAFSLAELKYEYPREITPAGHTPTSWLRQLTEEGAALRFKPLNGGLPPKVRAMIEHELALIAQLQYEPYVLTVADICTGRAARASCARAVAARPTRRSATAWA